GIPADKLDNLFQSFSQVDSSATRQFGGTGLGLAISSRLVELMGGSMRVQSEPGQGSTFSFVILAEKAESTDARQPRNPHLAGKNLLVVDARETTRLIVSQHAETWGLNPHLAASGAEALALLGNGHHFDAAIIDAQVQDMDGL